MLANLTQRSANHQLIINHQLFCAVCLPHSAVISWCNWICNLCSVPIEIRPSPIVPLWPLPECRSCMERFLVQNVDSFQGLLVIIKKVFKTFPGPGPGTPPRSLGPAFSLFFWRLILKIWCNAIFYRKFYYIEYLKYLLVQWSLWVKSGPENCLPAGGLKILVMVLSDVLINYPY